MRFDALVLIGQFAPFHNGHLSVVREALERARHIVILIGSADRSRNSRHPWTVVEREQMLRSAFPDAADRILVRSLRDHLYNQNTWIRATQSAIRDALGLTDATLMRIGLIGGSKSSAADYLRAFPQWPRQEVDLSECPSSEFLRERFLSDTQEGMAAVRAHVPTGVADLLDAFRTRSSLYGALVEEQRFVQAYRQSWASAPYPPTFVTVDGVVVHSGHVLLVTRGAQPGKGLWALPGGFVRGHERLLEAVIRELREETRLKLPAPVLRGSLRDTDVFDHPDRSLRGRTITHAFHFEFPAGDLPPVRGGDDAARARWIPLSELRAMESQVYEDHFYIIERFVGSL